MEFYRQTILPRLLDWSMSQPLFTQYRREVLAQVRGEVLEIGFGSGLNLPHYPDRIAHLTTIDANPGANRLAQSRLRASSITVDNRVLNGEQLPMADGSFDSVVSTWTLCSIQRVEQALREIYRVLKPGGQFFFIEHGLSPEPAVQVWQHRLTPIQKRLVDGCHLDRPIRQLLEQQFDHVTLKEFYGEGLPKFASYLYQGIATKQPEG